MPTMSPALAGRRDSMGGLGLEEVAPSRRGRSERSGRDLEDVHPLPGRQCGSPLGVIDVSLPVDHYTRLVTDDPSVVAGCHDGEVPRPVFHLFAVVHHDLHST